MVNSNSTFANLKQLDKASFKKLCEEANKMLKEELPLSDPPTEVELERILNAIAEQEFYAKFPYRYHSIPPDVAPDAKRRIISIHNICSITNGSEELDQIGKYVDSTLLKSIRLEWVRAAARPHLVKRGEDMFNGTLKAWNTWPYTNKYHDPYVPEQNSFKFDGVAVYRKVPTTKLPANTVIYYIAVYYEFLSPTKVAKVKILDELIKYANGLLKEPIYVPPDPSMSDLERILEIYGKKIFEEQFRFPYRGDKTHPPDLIPYGSIYGEASLFTEDVSPSGTLCNVIPEYILSTMKIPEWAEESALTDLKTLVATWFNSAKINEWFPGTFEKQYSFSATKKSCRTAARLVFAKGLWTVDDVTISTWYVYYIGIYYDSLSPFMVVRNRLLTNLCDAANELLPEPVNFPSPPTAEDLNKIIAIYGKTKFESAHGFAYQGTQTAPDDLSPGTPVEAACDLLEIADGTVANLDIELERKIFRNIQFPCWVSERAKTDLRERLGEYLSKPKNNTWDSDPFSQMYLDTFTEADGYRTAATLTFCNAQLKENDITVTITYIHYTGVYYYTQD